MRGWSNKPPTIVGPARRSSAAAHLLGIPDESRVLDLEFWKRAGGAATWAEMHQGEGRHEELLALRKYTYSGRPFGDETFVKTMEERFQRRWRRGPGQEVSENAISA